MNNESSHDQSRRRFLKKAFVATGAVAVSTLALTTTEADAAKTPKKAVQYQEKPHNKQMCSGCQFYIASKSGGKGKCQVVQGAISPKGWCSLYQAKS